MKKRIFIIFLTILVAVTNMSVCYADGLSTLVGIDINNYGGDVGSISVTGSGDTYTPEEIDSGTSSGIQKVMATLFRWLFELLVDGVKWLVLSFCPMMDVIVFNDPTAFKQNINWGNLCRITYFTPAADNSYLANTLVVYVSKFYQLFRYLALIGFVVAIAAIAVKMIISSIGKQKAQYKDALKNWLVGLVLLVVGHWIMIYLIYFSDYLVNLLRVLKGTETGLTLAEAFSDAVATTGVSWPWYVVIIWGIMAIVAILMFAVMNIKILKVYLERVIVVGVLIMIFPLVTVFYAFEKSGLKKGATFDSWLKTFVEQVFIQPVHALSMVGVIIALKAIDACSILDVPIIGMIVILMVLNSMFAIENVVKRVFGINGAAMGQAMNPVAPMLGAAALGGIATAGAIKGGIKLGGKIAERKRINSSPQKKADKLLDKGTNLAIDIEKNEGKWSPKKLARKNKKLNLMMDNYESLKDKGMTVKQANRAKNRADRKANKDFMKNHPKFAKAVRGANVKAKKIGGVAKNVGGKLRAGIADKDSVFGQIVELGGFGVVGGNMAKVAGDKGAGKFSGGAMGRERDTGLLQAINALQKAIESGNKQPTDGAAMLAKIGVSQDKLPDLQAKLNLSSSNVESLQGEDFAKILMHKRNPNVDTSHIQNMGMADIEDALAGSRGKLGARDYKIDPDLDMAGIEAKLVALSARFGDSLQTAITSATGGTIQNLEQAFEELKKGDKGKFQVEQLQKVVYSLDNADTPNVHNIDRSVVENHLKEKLKKAKS